MDDIIALKMESHTSDTMPSTSDNGSVKIPKNSKENRYYYKHREEILEKRLLKKLENPEYEQKQGLKAQKELLKAEKQRLKAEKESEKQRLKAEKDALKAQKIKIKTESLLKNL
jgi:hypothetical protein